MKKILQSLLATTLLLQVSSPISTTQALSYVAPLDYQNLGGQGYISSYSQVMDYLSVIRYLEEKPWATLPTKIGEFSQSEAETLRAQAGNRRVYHEILGSLVSSSMTDAQKTKAIYDFPIYNFIRYDTTKESLPYGYAPTYYDKSAVTVLDRGSWLLGMSVGGCQEYSTLFNRLMNTAGIPCFNVYGDYVNTDGTAVWHAFNRAKINGVWYWYDVDVEGSVYRRGGYANPLYYLYEKDDTSWYKNHTWIAYDVMTKESESAKYLQSGTIIQYDGDVEIYVDDIPFVPSAGVHGYVDIDSDFFTESIMLLPILEIFPFLGLNTDWDTATNRIVVEEGGNRYEFSPYAQHFWMNGVVQPMAVPVLWVDGQCYISADDLLLLLDFDYNMQFYGNTEGELVTVARFQDGKVTANS